MELNFLFGNPVKGKKGGKKMAAKKRAKSSAPKKGKVSARKNPWSIGGKRYYTDDEIDKKKIENIRVFLKKNLPIHKSRIIERDVNLGLS